MPRVVWSPRALADLKRLHSFLERKNADAAARAIAAIREGVSALRLHPELGRPVPHLEGFREFVVPFGRDGYVAFYRPDGDRLVILAVRHEREAGY